MEYLLIDTLRERFAERGLVEAAEDLIARARGAVAIRRERCDDADIPIGASKLGGLPDLPPGVEWPTRDGYPLGFLGQFAIADVPEVEGEVRLPGRGLLSVFFIQQLETWGHEPTDWGAWRLLYRRDTAGLSRVRRAPARAFYWDEPEFDEPFRACRVWYETVTTYPAPGAQFHKRDDWSAVSGAYYDITRGRRGAPGHQFFGHEFDPYSQAPYRCVLLTNGLRVGVARSRDEQARVDALVETQQGDWVLLLQIQADDETQWNWGDIDTLYFWIRRQDLEAGEFDKVWCIQS